MKKVVLILLLLVAATVSLFADRLIFLQGVYLNTGRTYESDTEKLKDNFSEFGISLTSFYGENLGFYINGTFLLPLAVARKVNGNKISHPTFDSFDKIKIGLDMLIGIGYRIPAGETISLLFSGGLHFNGIALLSGDKTIDPYLAYNLGPGISVTALYHISEVLNINLEQ